jgi:large subunit ribosomal protein L24
VSKSRIKKGDIVVAMSGANAGKTGKVLELVSSRERAIVEGLRMIKKHMKKSSDHPKGAIVEKEGSMSVSVLLPFCPHCKKGVRIKRVVEAEKNIRKCKKCGHPFDG